MVVVAGDSVGRCVTGEMMETDPSTASAPTSDGAEIRARTIRGTSLTTFRRDVKLEQRPLGDEDKILFFFDGHLRPRVGHTKLLGDFRAQPRRLNFQ